MEEKRIEVGEAVNYGWNAMKSNIPLFLIIMIIYGVVEFVPGFFDKTLLKGPIFWAYIIVKNIVSFLIGMGFINIALKIYENKEASVSNLFDCYPLLIKYFLCWLLSVLIIIAGCILLIIPGIIWGIKIQFWPYLIIDKGMSPIEALKKSARLTDGVKLQLLGFGILLFLINLLGLVCIFIGLVVTIPVTIMASVFVYKNLLTYVDGASDSMQELNIH